MKLQETLVSLFDAVARTHCARTALIDGDRSWSYEQLDAASDSWAADLERLGVRRGEPVGLMMDRSAEAILGMLAILKVGAVYVPLDPLAPADRLRSQAAFAGLWTLLVRQDSAAPDWFDGRVSAPSISRNVIRPRLDPPIHPDELAYIIHTSGSTARPKSVCISHKSVAALITSADYCDFRPDDRVFHCMSIAFDGSTFEIWGALLTGACLVIAPASATVDELCALAERHLVTIMMVSTGVFNLLDTGAIARLKAVRVMLAGGDVMSPQTADRFLAAHRGATLVNGYGPSEVTTFSHCFAMCGPRDQSGAAIPIGAAIPGMGEYVLDQQLQRVPPGTPGELFITGNGLAWGYLHDPALTAERFLPDPFAGDGSRMYRSGDWVVEREGGVLYFLERMDLQVKIRGFRVELGEIEGALRTRGDLLDACLVHRKDAGGRSTLHAFALPQPGAAPPNPQALLDALRRDLPDYMVPAEIKVVDALPLTISGKVDRAALSAVLDRRDEEQRRAASYVAASDDLLPILRQMLGHPQLSRCDNFFDAGGDSLTAMRFCAQVDRQTGVKLPLTLLFEADTIGDVLDRVTQVGPVPLSGPSAQ